MLSVTDTIVIGFYFLLTAAVGLAFRRFNRDSDDFFRGGARMPWWLVGSSAFMAGFSAWAFTGAAAMAFQQGWLVVVIFLANALGFLVNATGFAAWLRQLRVVTGLQAVHLRFGRVTEQFYVWLQMPLQLLGGAISLFGLAVFVAPVIGMPVDQTILLTGIVITAVALIGGTWASSAGDFVQALVLLPITVVVAVFALGKIGGVGALFSAIPVAASPGSSGQVAQIGWLWALMFGVKQLLLLNNLQGATRYVAARDGEDARRAALLASALFLVGSAIWFVPPLAARALQLDLSALFPGLARPEEGAYLAMALRVLPAGLLGVLITGIFSATMSSLDTALNRNAGVWVKNVYEPLLRPGATERELLVVARLSTAAFGAIVIGVALLYQSWSDVGLFRLMINFSALVTLPLCLPLFWGILIRRAPAWAGWSTALVGLLTSLVISRGLQTGAAQLVFDSVGFAGVKSWARANEFAVGVAANVVVGSGWFWGTTLFHRRQPPERQRAAEEFFARLKRPVDFAAEVGRENVKPTHTLGWLCLAYGGFLLLLVAAPNEPSGRLAILFCAVCVLAAGAWLWRAGRASARK